tara:strand:+ start:619 stop:984 length:366 start_codon:yes stop_codon:yes gene_type:complete
MTTELFTIDLDDMNELISKLPYSQLSHLCWKSKSPALLAFIAQSEFSGYNISFEILRNSNTPSSTRDLIEQKLSKDYCYLTRTNIAQRTEDKCLLIQLLQDTSLTVTRAAEKRLKELLSLV